MECAKRSSGLREHVENFGILTSNSTANVDVFLRNHGIRDQFGFVSSTSKLTGKARHLRAIRKTFSLKNDEMLYIGDEIRDMKAAQKARIPHAAVSWGFNSRESLQEIQADLSCSTVRGVFRNSSAEYARLLTDGHTIGQGFPMSEEKKVAKVEVVDQVSETHTETVVTDPPTEETVEEMPEENSQDSRTA